MLLLSLTGCTFTQSVQHADAELYSFNDDLGRCVRVGAPQRVAVLLGSFAQIWMLAGGSVCAAPEDAWCDLHLDLAEDVVNLGRMHALQLEALLASQPDFILASTNTQQNVQWRDTLESIGIPVAYFDVNDVQSYLRMLKICTDITGQKTRYEQYGTVVAAQVEAVIDKSRVRLRNESVPSVLCLTASAAGVHTKNSTGCVLSRILQDLGCWNVADSDAMLLEEVSLERILEADPDYIFFIQRGDDPAGMYQFVQDFLTTQPAWSALSAVQNGRVYYMEKELFHLKPNERWGDAYERAEEILSQ